MRSSINQPLFPASPYGNFDRSIGDRRNRHGSKHPYSGCQNNAPLFGRYFITTVYAATIIFGTYLRQTV
jgi:hypothetical protein